MTFKMLTIEELLEYSEEELTTEQVIRELLNAVLVYGPDYMHGQPKSWYEEIANKEIKKLSPLT